MARVLSLLTEVRSRQLAGEAAAAYLQRLKGSTRYRMILRTKSQFVAKQRDRACAIFYLDADRRRYHIAADDANTAAHRYRWTMPSDVGAITLTGTIGAGKTTLAEAISEELHERGIRHALIDLDWLGQVYPTPEGHDPYAYELALQNLNEIWPNFEAVGADRAVIAGTLLNRDHRERLHDALGLRTCVVLVEVPQDVLEARIRKRDTGRLLSDFLARTGQVAADIKAANIHDLQVDNHAQSPREVGLDVLRRVGWLNTDA